MVKRQALGGKFDHSEATLDGSHRAFVNFTGLETLWLNTGTLCNIECANYYIKSSPKNDSLIYLSQENVNRNLRELSRDSHSTNEIGFTGGEPFMNPEMIPMSGRCLDEAYRVLILTNALRPMMRPKTQQGLLALQDAFGVQLTLRVSVVHWSQANHDKERVQSSFQQTIKGMRWLSENGFYPEPCQTRAVGRNRL